MDPDGAQSGSRGFDWGGLTLFLVSGAAAVLCGLIVWPFLPALTGAVVLAIVTRRPYRWLAARFRNRTVAAAVALVLAVLSIVTPAMLVAYGLGYHVLDAARVVQSGAVEQQFGQFMTTHPRIRQTLQFGMDNADAGQAVERSMRAAAGKLAAVLGRSITALFQIVVMLFVLFFLYRDEKEGLRLARSLLPLDDDEADYVLQRVKTVVQALVLGRFAVAGLQGLVAGITFACLGVHGATLLGLATVLFALVPAVGAYVVWLPVAIYLALAHYWIQAVILLAIGSLLISTLDNFLYPILVGSRLQLHTVPIFFAMMGGIWLFGVCGLVLGPIVFNLTASLFRIGRSRARGEPLPSDPVTG